MKSFQYTWGAYEKDGDFLQRSVVTDQRVTVLKHKIVGLGQKIFFMKRMVKTLTQVVNAPPLEVFKIRWDGV